MITYGKKIDWLQHIIDQKKKEIASWQIRSFQTNICDNTGVNPMDKITTEIRIAEEIIDLCVNSTRLKG